MSTLRAYLGVAGLMDIGYRIYTQNTPVAARQTASILDEGGGWYSVAGVTLAGDHVRWDSTGDATAVAREDFTIRILVEALYTKLNLGEPEDPVMPIFAPEAPDQAICYFITRDASGTAEGNIDVFFRLLTLPEETTDSYESRITATSDEDGVLSIALVRGATYGARRDRGEEIQIDVPDEDSFSPERSIIGSALSSRHI